VVDTVFVCRSTGVVSRRSLAATAEEFADLVNDDLDKLCQGGLKPTRGDTRCIIFGHLVRMTVWQRRETWDHALSARQKLMTVASHLAQLPHLDEVEALVSGGKLPLVRYAVQESPASYSTGADEICY
jgi:putative DNA methylase